MAFVKNPYVIGIAISIACNLLLFILSKLTGKHNAKLVKLAKVVQRIPAHIIEAESVLGPGKGDQKLQYVLHLILIDCNSLSVDYVSNEAGFIAEVEKIMATPQKHEHEIVENA